VRVLHIVGARPNFMKVAPIMAQMSKYPSVFDQFLVHTGQHYDERMSAVFFEELGLPRPSDYLNVGSGSHAEQTARVMLAFERVVLQHKPALVVVVGDVNSTVACSLVCAKLGIPVAHVEAGLRSGDRTMPEEINRIVTDQLAELLFTPSRDADCNLRKEGIDTERIHFVGNVMIDTLVKLLPTARERNTAGGLGLQTGEYVLATIHRPSNVDDSGTLAAIMEALREIAAVKPVLFPVHPRTRQRLEAMAGRATEAIRLIEPQSYLDFVSLTLNARMVITDSGGVQEETTFLGVPCLTLRHNTERPVTLTHGSNRLVPRGPDGLVSAFHSALDEDERPVGVPEYWDGQSAARIVSVLLQWRCGTGDMDSISNVATAASRV